MKVVTGKFRKAKPRRKKAGPRGTSRRPPDVPTDQLARQDLVIELMVTTSLTRDAIAKRAGVCRRTIYEWFQRPAFQERFRARLFEAGLAEIPAVDRAVLRKAKKGVAAHAHIWYRRMGMIREASQTVNVNPGGPVAFDGQKLDGKDDAGKAEFLRQVAEALKEFDGDPSPDSG